MEGKSVVSLDKKIILFWIKKTDDPRKDSITEDPKEEHSLRTQEGPFY